MKELNTNMRFNDLIQLFNGKSEFIIVPKGRIIDFDNDVFVGVEAGTKSDPFVASVCDDSKVHVVGTGDWGPIYSGWEWHDVRGYAAYAHNKSKHPEIFLYEAINVKTGQKIKFNGSNLKFDDSWASKFNKLTNKNKNGYRIAEYFTHGEIDGETVELKIVPRIIKLSDDEISENKRKARQRKESTINRLKNEIEAEKRRIKYAENNIVKLEEKLEKLLTN